MPMIRVATNLAWPCDHWLAFRFLMNSAAASGDLNRVYRSI